MKTIPPPNIQREQSPILPCLNTVLPGWEQLPLERQRELVLSLAAMLVKRLAAAPTQPEVDDD